MTRLTLFFFYGVPCNHKSSYLLETRIECSLFISVKISIE